VRQRESPELGFPSGALQDGAQLARVALSVTRVALFLHPKKPGQVCRKARGRHVRDERLLFFDSISWGEADKPFVFRAESTFRISRP